MRLIVDTGVWIDFIQGGLTDSFALALGHMLDDKTAYMHPLGLGELSVGVIENRGQVFDEALMTYPCVPYDHDRVLHDITMKRLFERRIKGLGYIDIAIVLAAYHSQMGLWSNDGAQNDLARDLGVPLFAEHPHFVYLRGQVETQPRGNARPSR